MQGEDAARRSPGVINRRNPDALQGFLAAEPVHHAAGGYPDTMDVAGVTAMMADFLGAFDRPNCKHVH